jgi:exodeoxyribonuclease VII small subunit
VASAGKNAGTNDPAKAGPVPFEQALKKLEDIVESMESQDLALDVLLSRYEEGTRLARICQDRLSEAELKIQQLEQTASGDLKLKSVPPGVTDEANL